MKYPTPEDMLCVSTCKLSNMIDKCSHGRHGRAKAEQIKDAATNSFGIKIAKDAFSFQIKQMMSQICFIEEQLEELDLKIPNLLHEANSVITTIIGIGNVLGVIIVGEIGDISRFDLVLKLSLLTNR